MTVSPFLPTWFFTLILPILMSLTWLPYLIIQRCRHKPQILLVIFLLLTMGMYYLVIKSQIIAGILCIVVGALAGRIAANLFGHPPSNQP